MSVNQYSRARLDDRQVTELIGLARGMLADGVITPGEVEYLQKWLAATHSTTGNPVVGMLQARVEEIMADGIADEDECADLMTTLVQFTGSDFEIGEVMKATTLPVNSPAPALAFDGKRYCFTGTFVFGSRRECEASITALGATAGTLTKKTDVLVIGEYATDSWAQSSYGRKIEKACVLRDKGGMPAIVTEQHWRAALAV